MPIDRQNPEAYPAPSGHYSHIAFVPPDHRVLMCAGQLGMRADGSYPEAIEDQFELAIEACIALLATQGADAGSIVKVTYYLTERPQDFARIRAAIQGAFGPTPPAATYLIVNGLARPEMKVEIDIMAALPA